MKEKLLALFWIITTPFLAVVFVVWAIVDLWTTGGESEEE